MIGHPELTLDGTINSVQVLLELLGEPMNAYGLKHAQNWSLDMYQGIITRKVHSHLDMTGGLRNLVGLLRNSIPFFDVLRDTCNILDILF